MKTFKDILKEDVENTFFNTEEFAEECMWNGTAVKAVVDDDSMVSKYAGEFEFLAEGSHLVMVPQSEMEKPKLHSLVNFNGDMYEVHQVDVQAGIYLVFLNRGKS